MGCDGKLYSEVQDWQEQQLRAPVDPTVTPNHWRAYRNREILRTHVLGKAMWTCLEVKTKREEENDKSKKGKYVGVGDMHPNAQN
jgi:hypothetical protein